MSIVQDLAGHCFGPSRNERIKFETGPLVPMDSGNLAFDLDKCILACKDELFLRLGRKNLFGSVESELKTILPIILEVLNRELFACEV